MYVHINLFLRIKVQGLMTHASYPPSNPSLPFLPLPPLSRYISYFSLSKKKKIASYPSWYLGFWEWGGLETGHYPRIYPPGNDLFPGGYPAPKQFRQVVRIICLQHTIFMRGLAAEVCFKIKYLNTMYKPCTINSVSRSCPLHFKANSMLHNAKHKCKL